MLKDSRCLSSSTTLEPYLSGRFFQDYIYFNLPSQYKVSDLLLPYTTGDLTVHNHYSIPTTDYIDIDEKSLQYMVDHRYNGGAHYTG